MSHVALLPSRGNMVIEDDTPAIPHGESYRKKLFLRLIGEALVAQAAQFPLHLAKRQSWDCQMVCKQEHVQWLRMPKSKLLSELLGIPLRLSLKAPPQFLGQIQHPPMRV